LHAAPCPFLVCGGRLGDRLRARELPEQIGHELHFRLCARSPIPIGFLQRVADALLDLARRLHVHLVRLLHDSSSMFLLLFVLLTSYLTFSCPGSSSPRSCMTRSSGPGSPSYRTRSNCLENPFLLSRMRRSTCPGSPS